MPWKALQWNVGGPVCDKGDKHVPSRDVHLLAVDLASSFDSGTSHDLLSMLWQAILQPAAIEKNFLHCFV